MQLSSRAEEKSDLQRLFFALWPTPALQRQLYTAAAPALRHAKGGRRTPVENLHLTLAFLGSVDADIRARLQQSADGIRVSSFELEFDHIGSFVRRGLLWIGPVALPLPLLDLVNALKAVQLNCGLTPETRDYKGHVTLVRDMRRCPPATPIAPIDWPVREFALVRSHLGGEGARYEIVRTWPLAPTLQSARQKGAKV